MTDGKDISSTAVNPDGTPPDGREPITLINVREGMFSESGDTSGYGGLVKHIQMPGPSDRPYGEWFDGVVDVLEELLGDDKTGGFCHGDTPTLADCCLVPQVYNARRFNVGLAEYPRILAIDARCAELPAFKAAHPAAQPDTPPTG